MIRRAFPLVVCIGWLALFPAAVGAQLTKPSDTMRQIIQKEIDISNRSQKGYDEAKKGEKEAIKRGDLESAKFYADLAKDWEDLLLKCRRKVVQWVDEDWNIPKPPNTTIKYLPYCRNGAYGLTWGTKTDIHVGICPGDFEDGPDLIASTKIHELKHAWQIYTCMSSNPGYWTPCTFWDHYSEWEAYNESEKAHDAGILTLPPEQKRRISEAIKERRERATRELMDILFRWFGQGFWVIYNPTMDQEVPMGFTMYNPTASMLERRAVVTDEQGWIQNPPLKPLIMLEPEQEYSMPVWFTVPAGTPPGTANPIAVSGEDSLCTDVVVISVVSTVGITPGPAQHGLRGDLVPVSFDLENRGTVPYQYTIEVSNPLGWPVIGVPPTVLLNPGESVQLNPQMQIPADLSSTFTTNLVFCRATSQLHPVDTNTAWLSVGVDECDLMPLGLDDFGRIYAINEQPALKPVVFNRGHIDSFFDVFIEVDLPGGAPFHSAALGFHNPGDAVPEGGVKEVNFPPLPLFPEPGTYTLRVRTTATGDIAPDNDLFTTTFVVSGDPPAGIRDWPRH
jgi:hypothetical protein